MFAATKTGRSYSQGRTLAASLLLHGLLLAWLLHVPDARVLAPSSVAAGAYGSAITRLYWPSHTPGHDAPAHRKLILPTRHKHPEPRSHATEEAKAEEAAANSPAPAPAAGMPYGTLAGGALSGDEIRPALPYSATDPVVDPRDLAGHEGSVIVEVTIDDHGNIVQKVVLQSLGPVIDGKVLAALESWHFHPATRNGVAVPSKQDVYYHFKPNS